MPNRRTTDLPPSGEGLVNDRARILIVDDDERNLLALRTVLEDIADIALARSGEEALRFLLKEEFAVILLDVFMPGIDGYETAQMIRGREQTRRIPIIFLSAVNKETKHLIRGYSMGAVDYVFKPVEPIVLQSKVAVFVDLYQMRREIQRKAHAEQQLLDANLRANAELLKSEQQLRLAEQRQLAIVNSLPLVLYVEQPGTTSRVPQLISGNFKAVTGYEIEDVRERPTLWHERLHPDDRKRVEKALEERDAGRRFAVEYRWKCADGQYKHFLEQAALLRDAAGKPVEIAGTLLDITDRRELELQLLQAQKMDAIGKLTGGIAHDFNNLLAAVLGGLGLIERRVSMDDDQRKIVTMTKHAAEQGAELVARLLSFARRQKLEPAAIDVAALATSVSDLLVHMLGGLITLEWDSAQAAWPAYADDSQLELALVNLIINARDAMPGGGTIKVRVGNETLSEQGGDLKPGDYVVFEIVDTGSGIEPALLERVMEPFFTTKPVGRGTGLGLSMVYGFAQQSGGAMRIESEVDRGTTVRIWLPRAEDAAQPETPCPVPEPVATTRESSLSILLVDDHDGVRAATEALLVDLGHDVLTAEHGQDAIEVMGMATRGIDLIVTDYAMPHISGSELVRRLREKRPIFPAILITGNVDALGAADHGEGTLVLSKPFTPDQLRHAIRVAMGRPAVEPVAGYR